MSKYLFVIMTIFIFSCNNIKQIDKEKQDGKSIDEIAKQIYKKDYKIIYNPGKLYALVTQRELNSTKLIPDLKFFVYSIKKQNIIFSDTLYSGKVIWLSPETIKAFEYNNKAKLSLKRYYIYDVKHEKYITDF